jgi:cell fate regulator YaaT (PSP1 superfamily)
MPAQEYLVSFGLTGEFGRFRATRPLELHRGDRVVVRSARGVELAEVLREATSRHAHFLPNTSMGQLLRRATADDEATERALRGRSQQLYERGRQLATDLQLPLELLDVEVLLDGEHAVLHYLQAGEADVRPFVSTLSREFSLYVTLVDLSQTHHEEEEAHGCGRPGCGRGSDGNCGTCGSGGGCSTCGSAKPHEVAAHFAELREQMERRRTALL